MNRTKTTLLFSFVLGICLLYLINEYFESTGRPDSIYYQDEVKDTVCKPNE